VNSKRKAIFSRIAILTAVILVAGVPLVSEYQAFAFSHHGGAYGFYGPCVIRHFSYTWCINRF